MCSAAIQMNLPCQLQHIILVGGTGIHVVNPHSIPTNTLFVYVCLLYVECCCFYGGNVCCDSQEVVRVSESPTEPPDNHHSSVSQVQVSQVLFALRCVCLALCTLPTVYTYYITKHFRDNFHQTTKVFFVSHCQN